MLPVIMFLAFDDPHDCFKCFGKDPDRNYSKFQLTKEECAMRRMAAKYSMDKEQERYVNQRLINER